MFAAKLLFFKLCDETPVQTEFVWLQSTNLYAFGDMTNTVHFTELSLAQICSIAEGNSTRAGVLHSFSCKEGGVHFKLEQTLGYQSLKYDI